MTVWKTVTLGDVLSVLKNGMNCEQTKSNNGAKITRIETISKQTVDLSRVGFSDISDDDKAKHRLLANDILFSHINSPIHVGKTALYEGGSDIFHGVNLLLMRVTQDVDAHFLNYYLNHLFVSGFWRFKCKQSINQASVNQKDIRAVPFSYPPLSVQNAIVAKLDAAFASIEQAIAAAERNADNAKQLFQSYLSDVFEHRDNRHSDKGVAVMRGVKKQKLYEICDFVSGLWTGKKPPFISVAVLRNTNFRKNGNLSFDDIAQLDVELKQYAKRKLQFGDIILEKSGGGPKQPVGRVCVFEKAEGEYSLSNFTSAIRVKDNHKVDYQYLHRYLSYLYLIGETERIQTNSTGIRNLNLTLYKDIQVPLPPLPVQKAIVAKLDELITHTIKLSELHKTKTITYNALKQSLLQQAFSGQLVDA